MKGEWDIVCKVCGEEEKGPPHGTTCFKCLTHGFKYCTKCDTVKPATDFYRRPDSDGLMSSCISCYTHKRNNQEATRKIIEPGYREARNAASSTYKRRQYATIEGKQAEIQRCFNRRKKMIGTYTPLQWIEDLEYFEYECAYCGCKTNLTVDHVLPVSKDGTNYIYNLIPACGHCNSSKCDHDIVEWYSKQSFYTEQRLLKIHKWFKDKQTLL